MLLAFLPSLTPRKLPSISSPWCAHSRPKPTMSSLAPQIGPFRAAEDLYFSYGSNMSRKKLTSRGDSDTPPIDFTEAFVSRLPDWRLVFNLRGAPPTEPVMGSIEQCEGEVVYGMTYRLKSDHCWSKLLRTEGITSKLETDSYHIINVQVETEDGPVWVKTLMSNPRFQTAKWMEPYVRPSKRYLKFLIEGAEDEGMPIEYVKKLKEVKTARIWEDGVLLLVMYLTMPFVFMSRRRRLGGLTKPLWTWSFSLFAEHEKRIENGSSVWWIKLALLILYSMYVVPSLLLYACSPYSRRFYRMLMDLMMKNKQEAEELKREESVDIRREGKVA